MELDATKAFAVQALNIQENNFLEAFGWVRLHGHNWKPVPLALLDAIAPQENSDVQKLLDMVDL